MENENEEWRKQMLLGDAYVSNEITEKEKRTNIGILHNKIISSNVKKRIEERLGGKLI